jgi:hypothetical protein
MDEEESERAWQSAVTKYQRGERVEMKWRHALVRYQRGMSFEGLRAMLRAHMPPKPPDLVVSPETMLWFKSLGTGTLERLGKLDSLAGEVGKFIRQEEVDPWSQEPMREPRGTRETPSSASGLRTGQGSATRTKPSARKRSTSETGNASRRAR